MKKSLTGLLSGITLIISGICFSQNFDGGEFIFQQDGYCISQNQSNEIIKHLSENKKTLYQKGKLSPPQKQAIVSFEHPLSPNLLLDYYGYYAISNYVDQDATNNLLDYNCGNRTYDGHNGTDFFIYPFPWNLYKNDLVYAIAAADGVITLKMDGEDDDHCSCFGTWNAIFVQHTDGSTAWYGHLKNGSLTSKNVGDAVSSGEFLGVVASSGCSTGPHLHFEVRDVNDNIIAPYQGSCNSLNANSWWASQQNYREPTLNAVMTHHSPPQNGCINDEQMNLSDVFYQGNTVYLASYYRDLIAGDIINHKLFRPDGSTWQSWSQTATTTYNAAYYWWSWNLPTNGPFGNWVYEVEYYGNFFTHEFEYHHSDCQNPTPNTWIGSSQGNWNDSNSNWSKGHIPIYCDDVIIPTGYFVTLLNGNTGNCNTVDVSPGGELIVESSAVFNVNYP